MENASPANVMFGGRVAATFLFLTNFVVIIVLQYSVYDV